MRKPECFRIRSETTRPYDKIRKAVFTSDSRHLVYVAANEGPFIQGIIGDVRVRARVLSYFYLVIVQLECRRLFSGVGIREKRFEIGMAGDFNAAVSPDSKHAMVVTNETEGRPILSVNLDDEFCPRGERRRRAHARMANTNITDIEAMFRDFEKELSEYETAQEDLLHCEQLWRQAAEAWVNRTFDTPDSAVTQIATKLEEFEYSRDKARKARKAQGSKITGLRRVLSKTILSHPRRDFRVSQELLSIYDGAARRGDPWTLDEMIVNYVRGATWSRLQRIPDGQDVRVQLFSEGREVRKVISLEKSNPSASSV